MTAWTPILALDRAHRPRRPVPAASSGRVSKPLALALLNQAEAVRLLPSGPGRASAVPAYAHPRSAARALAHAARYGTWRARPPGHVPGVR